MFNRRTDDAVPLLKYIRCVRPLKGHLTSATLTHASHHAMQTGAVQGMSGMPQAHVTA